MFYGGDYNPEQWEPSVWREDVALMREANVNLVSLGVFAWSRIQPCEGEFDFDWLDEILSLLNNAGVGVNLATATASPPQWATHAYPDILPTDSDGSTYWPGSRQHYSTTSATYRRLASDLVAAIADRYAAHPAVKMWHINNEYACHVHYDYSDNAAAAFRNWLRERYSTVAAVNTAWGTAFWSQTYSSFEEIIPPRKAPYSRNPSALLDFRRFTSDAALDLLRMEKRIIRASGATQPVTTNFMGAFQPLDYRRWAEEVDLIADDSYPDPADPDAYLHAAFTADLMRGLKPGIPWLLMEQAPNAVNWRPSNRSKSPGEMAANSIQAVARGADGVMFFQWRQSMFGSEKFHSAMLPHAGTATRTWSEIVELGGELQRLPAFESTSIDAKVAIMFDWENWWALDQPDHPVCIDYRRVAEEWHGALVQQGIPVDIIGPTSSLVRYKVVIAPLLYSLTDATAQTLTSFASGGGTLVVGPFSDVVDEHDRFRPGGFTTRLRSVLGMDVVDFDGLPADALTLSFVGEHHSAGLLRETLRLRGASEIATFVSDGRMHGPAITANEFGKGRAYYLATMPASSGLRRVARFVAIESGLSVPDSPYPPGVEIIKRGHATIAINHSPSSVTFELCHGSSVTRPATQTTVRIEAHGYRVFEQQNNVG